jgi:large subunit ribosomal protein L22
MGKPQRERALKDNEARAVTRLMRVSPQKLNLLAQLIRGKKVDRALADLTFSRKRVAKDVKKTLESAIANAENNHDLDVDALVVSEAYVGKNLVLKRMRARARGRAGRILKPFAQITVVVRQVEESACWDRRSIRSGSGSASTARGIRAGSHRAANMRGCCTKI